MRFSLADIRLLTARMKGGNIKYNYTLDCSLGGGYKDLNPCMWMSMYCMYSIRLGNSQLRKSPLGRFIDSLILERIPNLL